MIWLKIIGSAIGSFFAGIFGRFLHDRSVKKAEDERVSSQQAEHLVTEAQQAKEIGDEVDAMPAAGPGSASNELHAEFSRNR